MAPKVNLGSFTSSLGGVATILDVLREVDIRPIRAAAETPFLLAFVSRDDAIAQHLATLLYRGERMHDVPAYRTCMVVPFASRNHAARANAVVIVTREGATIDNSVELQLLRDLERARVPTLICFLEEPNAPPHLRQQWLPASVVGVPLRAEGGIGMNDASGLSDVIDEAAATKNLVRAIRHLKAIDDLALARHLPAFRESVSRSLIDDTAFASAVYSVGTGVLEVNPIADIPLNVADMIVLTKNQALMAYKIALAMGLPADFRTIMPQLAAVVGGGFLFRQAARGLIGLVPGLGIIPKVGIAFAGTYVTGEVIFRWCATGERINAEAIRQVYDYALQRGKDVAQSMIDRIRNRQPGQVKPSKPRKRETAVPLPAPERREP